MSVQIRLARESDLAQVQGAGMLLVGAFTPNKRAIAFYERMGFQPYELVLKLEPNE